MSIWPVARGVAWRTLHNVVTTPALLVPGLLFPLFFFVAFAGGLSQVSEVPGFDYPGGYTSFQFVFVLLQSAAFGGVFTGFGIARDFESGFGKRLLLAAPNRLGILLGYALAALGRWAITATVLTTVALVVGMDVGGGPVDVVGLYTLAVLLNAAALLWAAGIALRFRTIQVGPLMQVPVFLLLFFAPVYVPLELLERVDRDGCDLQSDHVRARGGPRADLRHADRGRARVRARPVPRRRLPPLGRARPAQGGGRGIGRSTGPADGGGRVLR